MQGPRNFEEGSGKAKKIKISIHDPFSAADLRTAGINVIPGYETTFLITPSQIVTSEEVKDLPFYRRNCLFQDEADNLVLFKYLFYYIYEVLHRYLYDF